MHQEENVSKEDLKCKNYKHNCMAPADREVVVFDKEFQWDQRPQPLQNGLIHHSTKKFYVFKKKIIN